MKVLPHLMSGLSAEAASIICREQCGAMCCRGPLILQLAPNEAPAFNEHAAALGIKLFMSTTVENIAWVRFSEHLGEHCPMLDNLDSTCRIYESRPQQCRDFPPTPTPGCPVSGG